KNVSFKCSLSFNLSQLKNHWKCSINFLNKSLKNNFIPLILIVSYYEMGW
ncbi:type III restriction endonuclease, partial [Helicobacter pylori]|nr:type III restriction endonuclease [Helicobacter pylori]